MPEKTKERSPFVERVPKLQNRKWAGMKPEDGARVVSEVLAAGRPAVRQLVAGLQEVDNGADWQERLLLHQLVTQCGPPERARERAMVEDVLVAEALGGRPATVRSFLLQQLRLTAGPSVVGRLAPLLKDDDRLVLDAVTAVFVSIGEEARKTLQEALPGAQGHAKDAIDHALNQIG